MLAHIYFLIQFRRLIDYYNSDECWMLQEIDSKYELD